MNFPPNDVDGGRRRRLAAHGCTGLQMLHVSVVMESCDRLPCALLPYIFGTKRKLTIVRKEEN
jgi:hypothetical protein